VTEPMADELEPWAALQMRNPAFARAYYKLIYSEPLPLRIDGAEYHRRQKRRKR
jgi:hypothetical protein